MGSKSPSYRWSCEHGGKRWRDGERRAKIVHRSWWSAWWHAVQINRKQPDEQKRSPYACYWGDDYRNGETAEKHWHVGRMPSNDMWGY